MTALALLIAGLASLAFGTWLLRRVGAAWRVGRLLAVAPIRSLADAAAIASAGEERYVRIHGRIDSDEEFPGDDDKPLVYRRRRLQRAERGGRWRTIDDERLAVPFGLTERGDSVRIDDDALGEGLIAVPRLSEGVAVDVSADAFAGAPVDLPPDTPVRLRIDQVSSIDHATAAGLPVLDSAGSVMLTAGLGRPLILTSLEPDEAMRVLGAGRRGSIVAGGLLLLAGILLLATAIVTFIVT